MIAVDIALATYNGANFIRQQIESIQKQTYRNWRLIISDDNSSDDTVDIIKDMMSNDSRIYLVGNKRQGGVIQNFNYALSQTTSEIVLLCDQDDIWPEERLEILIDKFKVLQRNDFVPAMMFTDLKLVDENNCLIAESFYRTNNINPQDNLKNNNLLWRSTVYGCTCIMNKKLVDIALPIPTYAHMHDQWLALLAKQYGNIFYFDYASVRYRQHSTNVVGGRNKTPFQKFNSIQKNLKRINLLVDRTVALIKSNNDFYPGNKMENKIDYLKFGVNEVLPYLFKGNKKVFSLCVLISLALQK